MAQAFQAEIKQLLNILIHSLYQDREIFLRELISNASDALNRVKFEMLTNPDVLDPDAELLIHLTVDEENHTIRVVDTGIGMTGGEMVDALGVIARSGARDFLAQVEQTGNSNLATDLIGQFGVGFYSVFMVAERVEVTSRSYLPGAEAATWISTGEEGYEIVPADKADRGTEVLIYLREDANEFASEWKLKDIVKRHSDFVTFPIYVGEPEESEEDEEPTALEPVNQRVAIWRRSSGEIEDEEYDSFYRTLTLDFEPPALHIHVHSDAPIQFYALLYVPSSSERNMFTLRKEPGLKLYARKVLIQEYTTALLPEYLWFVQGVVDSEDLPLNVSRETVQANPLINKLKQVITRRVLTELDRTAKDNPEHYAAIWSAWGMMLKQGAITEFADRGRLLPLMRFYTSKSEHELVPLDSYVEDMVEGQEQIFTISANDVAAASRSPHLDPFRSRDIEVLYLTDPVDGFLMTALHDYEGHELVGVDQADLDLEGVGETPEADEVEPVPEGELDDLIGYMQDFLGDQVESVRVSKVLSAGSPARLVTPEGGLDRHTERVYQMLEREYQAVARILEINPRHPIIRNLAVRLERGQVDAALENGVNLLYQNALLADGLHPNPADMAAIIQEMLENATRVDD
jgi:HSP90 family molecular chaperone